MITSRGERIEGNELFDEMTIAEIRAFMVDLRQVVRRHPKVGLIVGNITTLTDQPEGCPVLHCGTQYGLVATRTGEEMVRLGAADAP